MPTVLIVNDQELRPLCYRLLPASEPDLSPVGEAADGAAGGAEAVRGREEGALVPRYQPASPYSRPQCRGAGRYRF